MRTHEEIISEVTDWYSAQKPVFDLASAGRDKVSLNVRLCVHTYAPRYHPLAFVKLYCHTIESAQSALKAADDAAWLQYVGFEFRHGCEWLSLHMDGSSALAPANKTPIERSLQACFAGVEKGMGWAQFVRRGPDFGKTVFVNGTPGLFEVDGDLREYFGKTFTAEIIRPSWTEEHKEVNGATLHNGLLRLLAGTTHCFTAGSIAPEIHAAQ